MLNISKNTIKGKINLEDYKSFSMTRSYSAGKTLERFLIASFIVFLVMLFLPWTQNIRSKGYLTTLQPDQRPQELNSIIAGRIENWWVKEGDFVNAGDTIMQISEVKDDYFDPQLLERTQDQINSKEKSIEAYRNKIQALENQIIALGKTKRLKLQQAENKLRQTELKIESDSMDLKAAEAGLAVAENQLERSEKLYAEGIQSLTDVEAKRIKFQDAKAKRISTENKLLDSKNENLNARMELNSIEMQYNEKLAKAQSEKQTAFSAMYDSEATVSKMQNQYTNYSIRTGYYYIKAPQDGYVTKTIRAGIGETFKEGEKLLTIMPSKIDLAVSLYIDPVDLPLVTKGQEIRFLFDGWPAIAFSGWPNLSYGTFGGNVAAIDNDISENGKYRILVAPDPTDEPWPNQLRVGSGAVGMALLKDVPIWYELWRKLNGFPPDFYQPKPTIKEIK